MAMIHNEYIGWEFEIPQGLQSKLVKVYQESEDAFDELNELMHKKFPIIDTFHTDCISFQWGFDSMEEAQKTGKKIQAEIRAWLKTHKFKEVRI